MCAIILYGFWVPGPFIQLAVFSHSCNGFFGHLLSVFLQLFVAIRASLFIDYMRGLSPDNGLFCLCLFQFSNAREFFLSILASVKSFILLSFINTHFVLISYFQHFFFSRQPPSNACHSKYRTFLIKFPRQGQKNRWVVIIGYNLARKIFIKTFLCLHEWQLLFVCADWKCNKNDIPGSKLGWKRTISAATLKHLNFHFLGWKYGKSATTMDWQTFWSERSREHMSLDQNDIFWIKISSIRDMRFASYK